jgi:ATP-dependent DNA helicase RecQ
MDLLIKEMEQIVYSGTKLNIKYWIDEMLDDEQQEEIHDYFMESESDKIEGALKNLKGIMILMNCAHAYQIYK